MPVWYGSDPAPAATDAVGLAAKAPQAAVDTGFGASISAGRPALSGEAAVDPVASAASFLEPAVSQSMQLLARQGLRPILPSTIAGRSAVADKVHEALMRALPPPPAPPAPVAGRQGGPLAAYQSGAVGSSLSAGLGLRGAPRRPPVAAAPLSAAGVDGVTGRSR